jgi:N-acetyl sugar amidotransferase
MDTSDAEIEFDESGVCNHCRRAEKLESRYTFTAEESTARISKLAEEIRSAGRGRAYDSILGVSGGIDSSYVAYLAGQMGLRPLTVHFDNGWNSEIAVSNIKNIVHKLGFDLHTEVIDWEEFRDLQRAFLKASVIDIEMISDHAIFASMYLLARRHGIKYVLSGTNFRTEHTMPRSWYWRKQDLVNLKAIHRKFGEVPLRTFPTLTTWRFQASRKLGWGQKYAEPLNNINYVRREAMNTLTREFGWRYYGGKHYESVFTKFYQAYVLPVKFGVDKRRAHFSDLVHNGEMSRNEALEQLKSPAYDDKSLKADTAYVLKKLGFSNQEFAALMSETPRPHLDFASDQRLVDAMHWLNRRIFGAPG